MANVTNIILITSLEDGAPDDDSHPNVDLLNSYLEAQYNGILCKVPNTGGNKGLELDVFVGGFKQFDTRAFIVAARAIPWESPDDVEILIRGAEAEHSRVYYVEG